MSEEELKEAYPELINKIEQRAKESGQTEDVEKAVSRERERIKEIDSIASMVPDPKMVQDAKYGENPCTAEELCFKVMQISAASGRKFLEYYKNDGEKSMTNSVGAVPNGGAGVTKEEQDDADIRAIVAAYNSTKGGAKS